METPAVILFDTALGRCGLVWGPAGILASSFPYSSDDETRAHMRRRAPNAVEAKIASPAIVSVIDDIVALFEGEQRDLSQTDLDMTGIPEFERIVYGLTLAISPGETKTYGDLARTMGDVSLSRRIGQALGRNPIPIIVPCHRVVGANGAMTGFSAPGGAEAKRRLLKIEGALEPELFD
ncbi:MAG: methylated-DNA--[protein]-cysteine S-methyltransferase [Pseudomonadota bacterium]